MVCENANLESSRLFLTVHVRVLGRVGDLLVKYIVASDRSDIKKICLSWKINAHLHQLLFKM